jgi:hypothetical protein
MAKQRKQGKGKRSKVPPQYANANPRPIAARKQPKQKKGKGVGTHHVRAVCSVTDPFCPASKSSKWPDGTSGNTLTEQFRGSWTSTASTDGVNALVFYGGAPFGYLKTASTTLTAATWAAGYTLYKTGSLLATFGGDYRIVSFGVIARCVASANTASGLITFGTTQAVVAPGGILTYGTQLYDEVTVKSIQPGMELSWVSQPRGPTAREFRSQSTTTPSANDWTNLVVEITGGPATTALINFEWFMNVEFAAAQNASLSALATRNPPKSSVAESAVSKVHSSLGSFIEGGVSTVEASIAKHASSALSSMFSDPLESLAGLFGML